jgi:S1-C subfamily serine protease
MKQVFLILATVVFAIFGLDENSVQAQTPSDVVELADPSVGRVRSDKGRLVGTGTGFVISSVSGSNDLYFITNQHVIEGTRGLTVGFLHNQHSHIYSATIVEVSMDFDLAVLRLRVGEQDSYAPPPLKIARRDIKKGEAAFAVGFPGVSDDFDFERKNVLESTFSSGLVSRSYMGPFRRNGRSLEIVQHTAEINHGNSGGPLLDSCASVIGVNTLGVAEDNIYLGSSSNTLGEFLSNLNISYTSARADCNGLKAASSPTDADPEPESEPDANSFGADLDKWLIPGVIVLGVILLFGVIFAVARTSSTAEKEVSKLRFPNPQSAALSMSATLLDGSNQSFKASRAMLKSGLTIGRPGEATFGLNAGKVSRKHLRIYQDGRKLMAMDLGSTNGTKVNGKKLSANVATQINSSSVIDVAGVMIVLKT